MNKKAYSTGFAWVYGLVTLFGLGVLYIVFNQVLVIHLVPTIKDLVNNTGDVSPSVVATVYSNIDKYMAYFHVMPYVLFIVVIIFMLIATIRREGESAYR